LNTPATWACFAWLFVTAVLGVFAKGPLLVVAAIVFGLYGLVRFERRFPTTGRLLAAFLLGLCGRR
jgi:hypothetical protein